MTHYVCTGTCGGSSDAPGTCQATGCPMHGQSFGECSCGDGMHGKGSATPETDQSSVESGESA